MPKIWLVVVNGSPHSAWEYEWEAETEKDRLEKIAENSVWRYVIVVIEMEVKSK